MAINDDTDYPRLIPPDDRYPSPGKLFRSANDLTDDQFDLLAAAWSENALPDDNLAEMEEMFVSDPGKKAYAENYSKLRLRPFNEKWDGLHTLLRTTPAAKIIRRVSRTILAAAAVILAFLILWPVMKRDTAITGHGSFPEVAMAPEAAEKTPMGLKEEIPDPAVAVTKTSVTIEKKELPAAEQEQIVKIAPVTVSARTAAPVITAAINSRDLLALKLNDIPASVNIPAKEENWIRKGISGLSKTTKKEKTPVDGYVIAKTCIKGINSVFGSDIGLEKIISEEGDTVGVSFNSSLLSFSAPVRKSSQ